MKRGNKWKLICYTTGIIMGSVFMTSCTNIAPSLVIDKDKTITIIAPQKEALCVPYQKRYKTTPSKELAFYLEKLNGIKTKIETWSDGLKDKKYCIFLGMAAVKANGFTQREIKECGSDGFRIKVKNKNVYIAGGKYRGTEYGVYKFLEKLGVKFYAKNHEVIPQKSVITIPAMNILEKPFFESRAITNTFNRLGQQTIVYDRGYPKTADPKLCKLWGGWIPSDHTGQFLCPVTTYGKEHPEYYAQRDGCFLAKNFLNQWKPGQGAPSYLHLCMSNPDVRKISKKRLLKWIETQNDRRYFGIAQMDGFNWCKCKGCLAMDLEKGRYTDRLIEYINDLASVVAEKYPDKIIFTLGYLKDSGRPPLRAKPAGNVRVYICPYTPEVQDRAHNLDHPLNKEFYEWYKDWLKTIPANQIYIYDYPLVAGRHLSFTHPNVYAKMKMYAKDGIAGIYFDGRPPFMQDLFIYVTGKLAWDPNQDTDAMTKEFIESYYDNAAPYIQKIYNFLVKINKDQSRSQGPTLDKTKFYTVEELEKILKLYAKAEFAAKDNLKILKRIRNDKSFALFSWLSKCNPVKGTAKKVDLFKRRLGEYLDIAISKGAKQHFSSKSNNWLKSWFWKVARLKIDTSKWPSAMGKRRIAMRNNPTIKKLLNNPQSVEIQNTTAIRKIQLLPGGKGWKIPLAIFEDVPDPVLYKWECPPREAIFIKAKMSGLPSVTRAYFRLPQATKNAKLVLIGQDNDKPEKTPIRILLNGKVLFRGENKFVKNNWSECLLDIPAGTLKKGKNELVIENMSETSNVYAQWLALSEVKIVTKERMSASPIFKVNFDNSVEANSGANKEATIKGKIILSPEGKNGKALDAGFTRESNGTIFYQAPGNYLPCRGTAEMWVKLKWDPKTNKETHSLMHIMGTLRSGLLLFRYKHQKYLTFLMYNETKNTGDCVTGSIQSWNMNEWHNVAITWDENDKTLQMFLDGVLVGIKKNAVMGKETADRIYLGSRWKTKDPANALIDDFKIYDYVLWKGQRVGDKVFHPEK